MKEKGRYPNRLREIRDSKEISRLQAARDTGFHFVTVYRHETGQIKMSQDATERYSSYYKVAISELFYAA